MTRSHSFAIALSLTVACKATELAGPSDPPANAQARTAPGLSERPDPGATIEPILVERDAAAEAERRRPLPPPSRPSASIA